MRKNKIELKRVFGEEVQERYEEIEDRLRTMQVSLFDNGLEKEEVKKIIEKERMLNTYQIKQFYQIVR